MQMSLVKSIAKTPKSFRKTKLNAPVSFFRDKGGIYDF